MQSQQVFGRRSLRPMAPAFAAVHAALPAPRTAAVKARKVGVLLGAGLGFFPLVSVWLLLRPGYSATTRALGFAWAAASLSQIVLFGVVLHALASR